MGLGAFLTRKRRWPLRSSTRRIQAALVACALVLTVLMGRAVQLQAIDAPATAAEAAKKMRRSVPLPAVRGAISDRNGNLMAATEAAVDVVADPFAIATLGLPPERLSEAQKEKGRRAPAVIAQIVVAHLGGDEEALTKQLSDSKKRFIVIRRQVPKFVYSEMQTDLHKDKWYGVYSINHPKRIYPAGSVAANVIGFVTPDESKDGLQTSKGAAGLEFALDKHLAGESGRQTYETSPQGKIPLGDSVLTPAKDGASVQLTLDTDLNWQSEKILEATVKRQGASSGMALVMNVKNGEVLALANYPSFDPNSFEGAPQENLGNRVVTDAYEPGSVQKVLTMAALTDSGLVNPDTKVSVPPSLMSGGRAIKDAFSHGTIRLTARGVLANSSNIGTAKLARNLDKQKMTEYLSSFGLGRPTGLGLPGEAAGSIPKPNMPDYTRDRVAFGQGLSVTAIQEAAAVAGIVNGGMYNPPRVIESIKNADGSSVKVPVGEPRRVISEEASDMVVDMMEAVVASKVGRNRFPIPNYRMAAKSGTAERYEPSCGCYRGYTASFIAVAPVEDPQILVYVVVDKPTKQIQGSQVSAPAVREIMQITLPRYGIKPSTTPAPDRPIEY